MAAREPTLTPLGKATASPAVRRALLLWAIGHTKSPTAADDLVHKTLVRGYEHELSGKRVWKEPIDPEELYGYLGAVMGGFVRNQWRTDGRQPTRVDKPEEEPSQRPSTEDAMIEHQDAAVRDRCMAELRQSVAADPRRVLQQAVLDAPAKGIERPQDLAKAIGVDVTKIYQARKLLAEHARRILDRLTAKETS